MDIKEKEVLVWQVSSVSLALNRHLTLEEFYYIKNRWLEFTEHTSDYEGTFVIDMVLQDLKQYLAKQIKEV